jgi:hypothetical protein
LAQKSFDDVKISVVFTPATKRENIKSGENIATMFGKQYKWFTDLKDVAFTGNADTVNSHTVETDVPANAKFTDTTYSAMKGATASAAGTTGLVPAPASGKQTSFLRGDGAWVVPTNTWTALKGATSSADGTAGYAPAPPSSGYNTKYLRADGTWSTPPDTTYTAGYGLQLSSTNGFSIIYGETTPKADGTASVGTSNYPAREDHVHPAPTTVTGNAGTATKLETARNIDGFSFDGSANINHYATCTTAAATAAKVATINTGKFTLETGATVFVKFTYANTVASATLAVGGTTAKPIYYNGAAITASNTIMAGGIYQFVYDGTNWILNGGVDTNTNTTYSAATADTLGLVKIGSNITNTSGTLSLTKANITDALGYTPPTTDNDTKVTSVSNHYTPSGGTTTSASGGTLTDIANSTSGVQVVTGVTKDAAGHVTGVTSVALKATNTANTDTKVTQTNTATSADYRVILSANANDTTETTTTRKSARLTFNPSTGVLTTTHTTIGGLELSRESTNYASIKFTNSNGVLGYLGMNTVDGSLYKHNGSSTSSKYIIMDGNNTSFTATLTSGTEIGTLTLGGTTTKLYCQTNTNTDTKVTTTSMSPTSSSTAYYIPFATGATTGGLNITPGFTYYGINGTTTTKGFSKLVLGNETPGGTEGNKQGQIVLYGNYNTDSPLSNVSWAPIQLKAGGTNEDFYPFKVYPGNNNGVGLVMSGDGLTVIGGGESARNYMGLPAPADNNTTASDQREYDNTDERLVLTSDQDIIFYTNCNTVANRKKAVLNNSLNFIPYDNNTGSIGSSSNYWSTMYASESYSTTFHGNLDGKPVVTYTAGTSSESKYSIPFLEKTIASDGYYSVNANDSMCATNKIGTDSVIGYSGLRLGNTTPSGTDGNKYGRISLYAQQSTSDSNANSSYGIIRTAAQLTATRTWTFPDKAGTVALTSDITDTKTTQTKLTVSTTSNQGIKRPLLFGCAATNTDNSYADGVTEITATTATNTVNMSGLAWLETNYYTSGGYSIDGSSMNGKSYAIICAGAFKSVTTRGFIGDLSGNAGSASKLATARTINGEEFNGTANISLDDVLYDGEVASGTPQTVTLAKSPSNYDLLTVAITINGMINYFNISASANSTTNGVFSIDPAYNAKSTMTRIGACNIAVIDDTLKISIAPYYVKAASSAVSSVEASSVTAIKVWGHKFS